MSERPPAPVITAIIADAASLVGTDVIHVEVVSVASVAWTDGSLGCPQPGMFYTQAVVDGGQVIVRVDETELDYRVGRDGSFMICKSDQSGPTGSRTPPGDQSHEQVDEHGCGPP